MTRTTRSRSRGEQGVAIIITALCLIPLMTFAAFGVDLASWYSRTSYLQKSADAAALAGTVWMPNLTKARTIACESLLRNGIDGGDCGAGDFEVTIARGSTSTSLRITITDPNAKRYFSQVLGGGQQRLTRMAEAEYNLPIPLGSPLNYFGGDEDTTVLPTPDPVFSVSWPTDSATRPPANRAPNGCNVGTSSAQGFGAWPSTGSFNAGGFSSSDPQCQWTVTGTVAAGTTSVPPPDYFTRAPSNPTCRVRDDGAAAGTVLGRWNSGSPPTFQTSSGSGSPAMCSWPNMTTDAASIPPHFSSTPLPTTRPCRIGYATSGVGGGHWSASAYSATTPASIEGENQTAGNRLCQWTALITSTTPPTPPNPIESDRSPGFWANVYGPGQLAANGDPFSTRCLSNYNCTGTPNQEYKALTDPNRGFWYTVQIPEGGSGTVALNVFDAAINYQDPRYIDRSERSGSIATLGTDADFQTEFRVFKQDNPLDYTIRSPLQDAGISGNANPADGRCHWQLRNQTEFAGTWRPLCTFTASAGERYLVNVRSNTVGATNEAGSNGYAIEAVLGGDRRHSFSPSIYAVDAMAMFNKNPAGGAGEFYLAKVAPEHAGKTLVVGLYDGGDSVQNAVVYPLRPQAGSPGLEKVDEGDCSWTSSPAPNAVIPPASDSGGGRETSSDRINTGVKLRSTAQVPDSPDAFCGIQAAVGSTRQFNGAWLEIRVEIPADYACNPALNRPDTEANSCWWAIRYEFGGTNPTSDETTWQARVDGNPVHLTQ